LQEPAYYFNIKKYPCGERYQCLQEEVEEALKDVYEHYEEYLKKAPLARDWVSWYSYQNPEILQYFQTLLLPDKVLLGPEDRMMGSSLMTSSEAFAKKYVKILQYAKRNRLLNPSCFKDYSLQKKWEILQEIRHE
jgi:hypothetical protein